MEICAIIFFILPCLRCQIPVELRAFRSHFIAFAIMEAQNHSIDSTTDGWNKKSLPDHSTRYDPNETPTVNSTNPNYQPTSTTNNNHSWEKNHSGIETAVDKAKGELKKGQQHAEDIITKSKRLLNQQCKFNEPCFLQSCLGR